MSLLMTGDIVHRINGAPLHPSLFTILMLTQVKEEGRKSELDTQPNSLVTDFVLSQKFPFRTHPPTTSLLVTALYFSDNFVCQCLNQGLIDSPKNHLRTIFTEPADLSE